MTDTPDPARTLRGIAPVAAALLGSCLLTRLAHGQDAMHGSLGSYPMTRDASGTAWQPDAVPMPGLHIELDPWLVMVHGDAMGAYTDQSGPRGASETYQTSMLMAHAARALGEMGTLTLKGMLSLEPLEGARGYPLLFQAGETADGHTPLVDRQHPHNLVMEAAALYSVQWAPASSWFGYAALAGEPALGPVAFMHRYASEWNAEAPLTHHWLDSTHISYGVLTTGVVLGRAKLEVSAFNGHEPDQHRYDVELGGLSSYSARVTVNPTAEWSLQASHGRLAGPEQLAPALAERRSTASATYHRHALDWESESLLAWGRNSPAGLPASSGFLYDQAVTWRAAHTVYVRAEHLSRDDLLAPGVPGAGEEHPISKLTLGAATVIASLGHAQFRVGLQDSVLRSDAALARWYGEHPTGFVVYLRVTLVP